jgi:hypothetical protein
MEPAIGRIVHWVTKSGDHRPAIITSVHTYDDPSVPNSVNLVVFGGKYNTVEMKEVLRDEGEQIMGSYTPPNYKPQTWHEPERINA